MNKPPRPTPLTDAFISNLKEKMRSASPPIRQKSLANFLGASKQKVWGWLTGKTRKPNGEMILKMQIFEKENLNEKH